MNRTLVLAMAGLTVLALQLSAGPAVACSCLMPTEEDGRAALAEADVVFEGRVLRTRTVSPETAESTFEVLASYKGEPGRKVVLRYNSSSAACGFEPLEPGTTHRLFATREGSAWQAPDLCTYTAVTPEIWEAFAAEQADGDGG